MKLSTVFVALMAGSAIAAAPKPKTVTKTKTKTLTHTAPAKTKTVTASAVTSTVTASPITSTVSNTITDTVTNNVTTTDSVTNTVTSTTTVTATPTPDSFIGTGNMVVYAQGSHNGHVSKYGGWYLSGSPATYTGISMASDNSQFTLTTSQGPCQVLGSGAFNCSSVNTNSIFGQTSDGNLTYMASDIFGAANGPTSNAPGSIILDAAGSYTLNIRWDPVNND